jgi:Spy/CpxP family protein refolding chaperone
MTKLVVALGFCIAFAAGMVVGMTQAKRAMVATTVNNPPTTQRGGHRGGSPGGFLAAELNLTPQQQQQMERIWSETAQRNREESDKRRTTLRTQRDEAIAVLIGPELMGKYDEILKHYRDQQADLDREMRANFESAVKQTEEILTPEQQSKYKALLSRHQFRGPGPDRGGPDRGGPDRGERDRGSDRGPGDHGFAMPRAATTQAVQS